MSFYQSVPSKLRARRVCTVSFLLAGAAVAGWSAPGQETEARQRPAEVVGVLDFAPGTDPDYMTSLQEAVSGLRDRSALLSPGGNVQNFEIAGRWPGEMTDPIALTWSFVPDGTQIIDDSGMQATSTLFATLTAQFGDTSWIGLFQSIFDRYEELSGIDFTRVQFVGEVDDGAGWGSPEIPGVRGHIRIGMASLDGAGGLLAFAQEPQLPSPGEVVLDSNENWFLSQWSLPFGAVNTIAHEVGHAIGLDHICPDNDTKLMEPSSAMPNWGPQHDDVRGTHSLYGDPYESNDTRLTATRLYLPPLNQFVNYGAISQPFGPYGPGSSSGLLSIDRSDDVDWYEFQVTEPTRLLVNVDPIGHLQALAPELCGTGFQCCPDLLTHTERNVDLVVEFSDRNLAPMIVNSTLLGNPFGFVVDLLDVNVPYYLRISPAQSGTYTPQLYDITVEPVEPPSDCSTQGCDDGNPWNGTETCTPGGGCAVSPLVADCNMNWFEDEWDILSGASVDCDGDGVPDECEEDCNDNGVADECDLQSGTSIDCDANGVPDECEEDCNGNGIGDVCDIMSPTSTDSNRNGVPDECEQTLSVPQQYATLSEALVNANNGDTIVLAPGVYDNGGFRNLEIIDKTVQIVSTGPPTGTIIDLQGQGRAAYIASVNKPNRTTIRGIWFRNGDAGPPPQPIEFGRGGAILIADADVDIKRCIFSGNVAQYGGAIAIEGTGTVLTTVLSCLFYDNSAHDGAAVSIAGTAYPNLVNCTITENTATALDGAAILATTAGGGGGLSSSLVWNNTPAPGQVQGDQFAVQYCLLPADVAAQYPTGTNIAGDPRFVDAPNDDFHIRRVSPCVNMGNPFANYGPLALDIDGDPRVVANIVDIGSDERTQ